MGKAKLSGLSRALLLALCLVAVLAALSQHQQAFSREVTVTQAAPAPAGYLSLADLVTMIGADAAHQFSGFFTADSVRVEPFPVLGEFPDQRITVLGATLADQMTAIINAIPGRWNGASSGEQWLKGVIQEVDGTLRVHISGRNGLGEWRSYVANVEMSAPVYRAMHTYVAYER